MSSFEYLIYTGTIKWVLVGLFLFSFLIFITKTSFGISYRKNNLETNFRILCLGLLVAFLLYISFQVDKYQLPNGDQATESTIQSDALYLKKIITPAKEEVKNIALEIDTFKAALNEDITEIKLPNKLDIIESQVRDLNYIIQQARTKMINQDLDSGHIVGANLGGSSDTFQDRIENIDWQLKEINSIIDWLEEILNDSLRAIARINSRSEYLLKSKQLENMYYAMRALGLGALGALITLLASYVLVRPNSGVRKNFIQSSHFWPLLLGHTLMGALISVVAFGLLFTKQITIFQPEAADPYLTEPEYWRVTILCVITGAFAEKLYNAASNRVDRYVEEPETPNIDNIKNQNENPKQ